MALLCCLLISLSYSAVVAAEISPPNSSTTPEANPENFGRLQHLHILFRHGDRTPIDDILHRSVPFEQTWRLSPGQLTERGILQEFQLGQWIRKNYDHFIPQQYNLSEFHMRSTDIDRTLMSAQAVAAGIYQNASSPLQDYGIPWRPIPVHTVRQEADVLMSIAKCPCLDALRKIQMNSDNAIDFEQQHRSHFDLINQNIQSPTIDRFNHWMLADLLICMKANNMELPSWCTDEVFKEVQEIDTFYWNLSRLSDPRILRFEIGVFLHALVEHLLTVTQGDSNLKSDNQTKHLAVQHTMAYSGHDTDVGPFLAAMGISDRKMVPYSSSAIVELIGPTPPAPIESFTLRFRYKRGWLDQNGEYLQFERVDKCKGQPAIKGCRLDYVLDDIRPLLLDPISYVFECGVMQSGVMARLRELFHSMSTSISVLFAFSILIVASLIFVVVILLVVRKYRVRSFEPDTIQFAHLQPTA